MSFSNGKIVMDTTIMVNEIQSGERDILTNYEAGGAGITIEDGKAYFAVYVKENNGYVRAQSSEKVTTGSKIRLTGMYDGKNVMLFIDGQLVAKTKSEGTIKAPNNNTVMAIGTNPNGSLISRLSS